MLLILVAMQIIGVYFVRELEDQLVSNFKNSVKQRVNMLEYNLEEEMVKERKADELTLEEVISPILSDFTTGDIAKAQVIDSNSVIRGTSDSNDQGIVGKRSTELLVKRAMVSGASEIKTMIDEQTSKRILVIAEPIIKDKKVVGSIYLVAKIEKVFEQMKEINNIMFTGTVIALLVTAVLAVFLAQTITRPIMDMRKQALAMSRGNYSRKVKVYGYDEIGQLAITFNNLTKKLQDANSTTEAEKRKLSSVLTNMTDGVISTDRRGRIILINDMALQMLTVSRETAIGQSITKLLDIDDSFTFEQLLEETDSVILDNSTEKERFFLRANFSVVQKESGFVNGLIIVLHDITEQERIDEERREFVSNVSHELRTPLTTMRSYLEALAKGAWKDQVLAPKFLDITRTETERMIRLVNDLLQLSKLDQTEYKLTKTWVNFGKYLDRIIDRFEMSKSRNVNFERLYPTDSLVVEIDTDKLNQVIDNIISNALKYSPEGGLITFKAKVIGDFIEVSIRDQGLGIPKSNLEKVFERFYRVDKARTRKMGGTGLGLAIAKEMIGAHNGEIWAESEEGKGTAIFFTLPYEGEQEDEWE